MNWSKEGEKAAGCSDGETNGWPPDRSHERPATLKASASCSGVADPAWLGRKRGGVA